MFDEEGKKIVLILLFIVGAGVGFYLARFLL